MRISECLRNEWHRRFGIERATRASDMTKPQDCVASNVEVWMQCKLKADTLCPFTLALIGVHANDNGHEQQFARIATSENNLDISFGPAISERAHVPPNV